MRRAFNWSIGEYPNAGRVELRTVHSCSRARVSTYARRTNTMRRTILGADGENAVS